MACNDVLLNCNYRRLLLSSLGETFKTLRIQLADASITLSMPMPQEVSRNICLTSRKAQRETLSQVKRRRNATLAKQCYNGIAKVSVFFLSERLSRSDSCSTKCTDIKLPTENVFKSVL